MEMAPRSLAALAAVRRVGGQLAAGRLLPCFSLGQNPVSPSKGTSGSRCSMSSRIAPFDLPASSRYTNLFFSAVYLLVYSVEMILTTPDTWKSTSSRSIWPPRLETLRWDIGNIIQKNHKCVDALVFSLFPFRAVIKHTWGFHSHADKTSTLRIWECSTHQLRWSFFPLGSWTSLAYFFPSAKAYQLWGHRDMSKPAWITGLNLSRSDRDFFIQTQKCLTRKLLMCPSGGGSGPPLLINCTVALIKLSLFFSPEGMLPNGIAPCFWAFHESESYCKSFFKTLPSFIFFATDWPRILLAKEERTFISV